MTGATTMRLAWRNLWRSRRRTILALAAIGLSVTLVLAYDAILRAYNGWILDTVTGPMLGHIQAHAVDWRKDRAMDRTLVGVGRTLAVLRADPAIADAAARVYAPALAALGEEGFGVVVVGLDPRVESGPMRLLSGAAAAPRGRRVLVGRALAEMMGVRAEDEIAIVGQGADGSLANDLYLVAAVVETPVDFLNRQGILMDLTEAQALFAMPDEAHEIIVHVRDGDRLQPTVAAMRAVESLAAAEILDWRQLAPEMVSLLALVDMAGWIALVLVLVAAAAGVANTMLMATFERTRELGMLLALGAPPGRLVRMIVAEAIALGMAGAAAGSAAGIALVAITGRTGVDFAALTGGGPDAISFAGLRWSMVFYPSLAWTDVAEAVAGVIVTALVAALWPAARAARLEPVRALRE